MRSQQINLKGVAAQTGARSLRNVAMRPVPGRDLLQFGGWDANWNEGANAVAAVLGCDVPTRVNEAVEADGLRVMRIAHRRVRVCASRGDRRLDALRAAIDTSLGVITELGDSRTLLRLKGAGVRDLMFMLMPIDFAEAAFPLYTIAQSNVHHVPVLTMAVRDDDGAPAFELHVPRTFGESLAEWIAGHGVMRASG